jgi:RNA polymerase sigma factor (sigma-70 family)
MHALIRRLAARFAPPGTDTDEHLLAEFLAHRSDGAFAEIVRRHGPMVRGVCRRVLANEHDADDAAQAVFLVLVRKAESVRPMARLGNWLYGVAVNVARRARDAGLRRRALELTTDVPGRAAERDPERADLRAVIDEELSALPGAYRAAVVACDLEGRTRSEAAGALGWSEGTVASRLARGRALLADRLARRGLAVPAVALAGALAPAAAEAVPNVSLSVLVSGPSPAAEALATEVLKAMTTSKLQTGLVTCAALLALTATGAATVWACSGFDPLLAPPKSAPKPFPLESAETRAHSARAAEAWVREAPREVPPMGDKPGAPATAGGTAKPARFQLSNPARDITVVSDRDETLQEFFRRQEVMVATVRPADVQKLLSEERGVPKTFVDYSSRNTGSPLDAAYGAFVTLAPLPKESAVWNLLWDRNHDTDVVVFVRDATDKDTWHAVGVTARTSVGFFARAERVKPDDFAPTDLLHTKPHTKK